MAIIKRLAGPTALSAVTTTNVYNQGSALIYDVVRHIHVVNKTDNFATFSLWLGATGANAAGTELYSKQTVKPRDVYDAYLTLKMLSTDFLVGGSDTATALSITIEGEQIVV
jgi:hypothetical protein